MRAGNAVPTLPLRGAIVGFGGVAVNAHLPVWRNDPRFRIDAVVEPLAERVGLARRLLPEAAVYPDTESLIAAGCADFVDICTPPCFHEEQMLTACRAGMHVFCEKPLPASVEGLGLLQEAADDSKRVLFVVNNWKYAPLWEKVLRIVKNRRIGRIKRVLLSVLRTPGPGGGIADWRRISRIAGGGILLDHGWHNLYLVMAVIGDHPVGVSAQMEFDGANGSGIEERVDLFLKFPAAEARLHLSRRAARRRNDGVVVGDRGVLRINDDHLVLESVAGTPPIRHDFPEPLSAGSHHPAWMQSVVESFYQEISSARKRGANFTESRWCARLTDLAYQSHRRAGRLMETDRLLKQYPDRRIGVT